MRRTVPIILFILLFLTGCWDNSEVNESAFVNGVGLDKAGNKLKVIVEIVKPTVGSGGQTGGKSSGQHITLEIKAATIIEAARELIRTAKRRLYFGHARIFIVREELAKEKNFPLVLDVIRRDQMLRLNSYLFITDKDPSDIFNTPTLYENLTSSELVSVLEETKFIAEYAPIKLYEFYRFLKDHHFNAYVPIISIQDSIDQKVTAIIGTAVIKDNKMVGKLNIKESSGLNWLLNLVKGGTVTVMLGEKDRASIEVTKAKTKIKPYLDGEQLKVNIQTNIEGTLADNLTRKKMTKAYLEEIEKKASHEVEGIMLSSLKKLKKLKADITDFELILHRKYPKKLDRVKHEWDDIFVNAEINIDVDTTITYQGLNNESLHPTRQKPNNNPYRFPMSFFRR